MTATFYQRNLLWGTYGRNGNEKLQWKRLEELTSTHLQNILLTQKHIQNTEYDAAIRNILIGRGIVPKSYKQEAYDKWQRFLAKQAQKEIEKHYRSV